MANYEMMVIIDPTLPDADLKTTIDTIKKIVSEAKGKITKEDVWGDKKLAYKINRSERGYYVLLEMELDGSNIASMNGSLNLEKNIWRYMFVNQDA
jgi:small subunit ribosomal protein S6